MHTLQQPLVSIVITNYNYAQYLRQAIDSALNQTYSSTEVIVVDDGSTDNSRQVIESYKNKIIPVYKQNGGPASAFNAGFAVSRGDIVCLLDADDVFLPQKVENVVKAFHTYPGAVLVYHKIQNIDQHSKPFAKPWPPHKVICGDISSKVAKTGGWWPFPPTTALSFSRKFLSKVMNVPEQGEEYRVWVDCYLADIAPFLGEVAGIEQVLSHYRIHGSNQWSNPTGVSQENQEKRVLIDHECRIHRLNYGLERLEINTQVNLVSHLPYQLLQYRRGSKESLIFLTQLILKNPWQNSFVSKLKSVFLLWIQKRHFSRI